MNPDPPTSLGEIETLKLLKLKALAENTPDGFSTEDRIIRNVVPGTGTMLPTKRIIPKSTTSRQPKRARANFTTEIESISEHDLDMECSPDSDPSPEFELHSDLNGTYSSDQQGHPTVRTISSGPESFGPQTNNLQGHYNVNPFYSDPGPSEPKAEGSHAQYLNRKYSLDLRFSGPKAGNPQVQYINDTTVLDPGLPGPKAGSLQVQYENDTTVLDPGLSGPKAGSLQVCKSSV